MGDMCPTNHRRNLNKWDSKVPLTTLGDTIVYNYYYLLNIDAVLAQIGALNRTFNQNITSHYGRVQNK